MVSFDTAEALKSARVAARLSQSDLAARAGLSRMTVQKIEAGAIDPRLSTLLVLMRAVGLDLLLVPTAIRPAVDDFLRSGGRVVGQPAGTAAPASIVDVLTRRAPPERKR
jgi:transcriptional regulator with XRE-family HTH domain